MNETPILTSIRDFYLNQNLKGLRQMPLAFAAAASYNSKGEVSIEDFARVIAGTGLELGENEIQVS